MKRKQILAGSLIASLFFSSITFTGCDDPEPDPCRDKKPVTADFHIYEVWVLELPKEYKPLDTDTVATDFVVFQALEEGAQYEWTLGAETITTRSFTRHTFPRGKNIEVSLKVTKAANTDCFPDDDGEDFKQRKFYTTPNYYCNSRINGSFEGRNVGEMGPKRIVTIETCAYNPSYPSVTELRINNLVEGCNAFGFEKLLGGHKKIYFSTNGNCMNPTGTAQLSVTNVDSIRIEYEYWTSLENFNTVKKTFIGVRK